MNIAVIEFFIENLKKEEFEGKKILEVGSKYVNGSVRPLIEKFCQPSEYIGIDIEEGKFVDMILPAEEIVNYFGKEVFDVVIATELLEHVKDWRKIIQNMKDVLKPLGYIYITTRSLGFPFHAYPYDFWRYEIEDMQNIFSDFNIINLIKDPEAKGVFLKAQKPENYKPNNLLGYKLYSIILDKRTDKIVNINDMPLFRKLIICSFELLLEKSRKLLTFFKKSLKI
jgi:SAM-dependent methyltransferase